jgi:hypothetical protein
MNAQLNTLVCEPQLLLTGSITVSNKATDDTCVACNAPLEVEPTLIEEGEYRESVSAPDVTKLDDRPLDQLITAKADDISCHHREAIRHREAETVCWRLLVPLLDEVQQRLSNRGNKSKTNYTTYLRSKGLNPATVRSWRRRLRQEKAAATESVEQREESTETPLTVNDERDAHLVAPIVRYTNADPAGRLPKGAAPEWELGCLAMSRYKYQRIEGLPDDGYSVSDLDRVMFKENEEISFARTSPSPLHS